MLMATLKHRQSGFNSHTGCAAFAAREIVTIPRQPNDCRRGAGKSIP